MARKVFYQNGEATRTRIGVNRGMLKARLFDGCLETLAEGRHQGAQCFRWQLLCSNLDKKVVCGAHEDAPLLPTVLTIGKPSASRDA